MPLPPQPRLPPGYLSPEGAPRPHSLGLTPSADESLQSYIFRLANRRRTETPKALGERLGFKGLASRASLNSVERLALEASVPFESLLPLWRGDPHSPFVLFWNHELPGSALDFGLQEGRKVCPECLAERGRHLAVWDLSFISACPVHRKALVDKCHACENPIKWKGNGLAWCGCRKGGDLTKAPAAPVTPEQANATACVQGLLGDPQFTEEGTGVLALPPFRNMAHAQVIEFLVRLGLDAAATRPRRYFFGFENMGDVEVPPHEALARSLAAVRNWPAGFHAELDNMRRLHLTDVTTATQKVTKGIVRWATPLPNGGGWAIKQAVKDYRRAARELDARSP
ncbi:TniQ family protein [Roseomonas sp. KE0001]|uniref:TniQ family protein n=1 Tax=Roseomonas sp. KE0001 TaxID=2479201 RepID=UPI0018DF242B|nr:TniQ family protein [Roseomonas sp. KE0001]MBI0435956.1 hypothetical protein [Roseomonas sp. KE0001]